VRIVSVGFGVLVVLSAIGPDVRARSVTPIAVQDGPSNWMVELHLSGGFAGLDRTIRLESTGRLAALDTDRQFEFEGEAAAADVEAVEALLDAAAPAARGSDCFDCFVYELHIRVDGRTRVVGANDASLGSGEFAELVGTLSVLLQDALSGER
jgi:hypothetical protein